MRQAQASVVVLFLVTQGFHSDSDEPAFHMVPAANYTSDDARTEIIGGWRSDVADWPATFVVNDSCTGTAVGKRVVLTAAHCVRDGRRGVIELDSGRIRVTCDHHPDYEPTPRNDPRREKKVSPDFALCVAASDIRGFEFESVDIGERAIEKGDTVRLVGFGCNSEGGSDRGFGVLYEGDACITKLPEPPSYFTRTLGGAAVCFSDSGGGAFLFLNTARTRRVLIAVASRGDISTRSSLSTTSVPGFIKWARSWAAEHGAEICGIHTNATGCRPR